MTNNNDDILGMAKKVLLSGEIPDDLSHELMVGIIIMTYRKLAKIDKQVQANTLARKFMWAVVLAGGIQALVQFAG